MIFVPRSRITSSYQQWFHHKNIQVASVLPIDPTQQQVPAPHEIHAASNALHGCVWQFPMPQRQIYTESPLAVSKTLWHMSFVPKFILLVSSGR